MTTTRRKVLQAGVAIAATVAPGSVLLSAQCPTGAGATMRFYKVAYDGRFAAAASFGAQARRLSAKVHDIDGDITDLWYHDLYHRWRSSPVPVAGMTTFNSLLGLQMMASTDGLRVIYRAHHHRDGERVSHELFGPKPILAAVTQLRGSDEQWGGTAARIIMQWPDRLTAVARSASTVLDADRKGVNGDSLVSWILAARVA